MTPETRTNLETAHNNLIPSKRRVLRLKDGTEKSFIDLKPNDIFQVIEPDGVVDSYVSDGKTVSWNKCVDEPYLNAESVVTVKVEPVI